MNKTVGFIDKSTVRKLYISLQNVSPTKVKERLWNIFRTLLLIGMSYVLLYPILVMVTSSIRAPRDVTDPTVIWIPKHLTSLNFKNAYFLLEYPKAILNTLKLSVPSIIFQLLSCSMAGYGFARYKFKFREVLFALVLFTMIVPTQTIIIPLYMKLRFFDFLGIGKIVGLITGTPLTVNILNTPLCFYLPSLLGNGLRGGLYIYVFRQFFRGMPKELEDAARIDGCNEFKIFTRVMIPNAGAALLTVFLFSVVWHWNEYYLANMFFTKGYPLSVALTLIFKNPKFQIGPEYVDGYSVGAIREAGSLMVVLPILVLYFFAQKYFTESVERTGITG